MASISRYIEEELKVNQQKSKVDMGVCCSMPDVAKVGLSEVGQAPHWLYCFTQGFCAWRRGGF